MPGAPGAAPGVLPEGPKDPPQLVRLLQLDWAKG